MAQIQAGFNYAPTGANSLVTAGNLNQHVNNAQLSGGAVSEQPLNSVTADTDLLLIGKAANLFSQTKLQFTDTINSNTINVNGLSVDAAEIDTLQISQTPDGANARLFDIGHAIIHSNDSDGVRIGYNGSYFASRPAGVVDLNYFQVNARNFTFYNPHASAVATYTIDRTNLHITSLGGVGGNLTVADNVDVGGDVVIHGSLTVLGNPTPSLKASGSWNWDGTNLTPRRTPFNCSITRLGVGNYRITFTTPMSSPDYVVSALTDQWGGNNVNSVGMWGVRTSADFQVLIQYKIFSNSGGANDGPLDILVFD